MHGISGTQPAARALMPRPTPVSLGKSSSHFSQADWRALAGYGGAVSLLHGIGWGLYFYYASGYPALIGLGLAAYLFGLRHAFDADHIAAVDDTVRYLLQKGKRPLGVGFYFSLGHSSVVFILAVFTALVANKVRQYLPGLEGFGNIAGTLISGVFLWMIGILNLIILLDMMKLWKSSLRSQHSHEHIEQLLSRRGLLNRLFGHRLTRLLKYSWQMYPIGFLFGLGFDTASEIALLALTGGAAASNLPLGAVLSLPILFTAGMSMLDTADGVLMTRAYGWAFLNPVRKIFYNLTTTTLSVMVAVAIGTIELVQVLIIELKWKGPVVNAISSLSFERMGYLIVALFLLAWAVSYGMWKRGRFEQRYVPISEHSHEHTHPGGQRHSHRHFH